MPALSNLSRRKSPGFGWTLALLALSGLAVSGEAGAKGFGGPEVRQLVKAHSSPPLRSIKPSRKEWKPAALGKYRNPIRPGYDRPSDDAKLRPDPVRQAEPGRGPVSVPTPSLSFEGLDQVGFIRPPDTVGDVGPNHYVQMVNVSYAVWDKNGNQIYPDTPGDGVALPDLWIAAGLTTDPCAITNDGDPIVLYDQFADRWLLTQFGFPNFPAGPYYQCVAVSKTGDPVGDYWLYTFLFSNTLLNDYPKFGVWPDAYYMTANQFGNNLTTFDGTGFLAFERLKMLNGEAAQQVYFSDPDRGGLLPADADGILPPPTGAPNYVLTFNDDGVTRGFFEDELEIFEFHVDWDDPGSSTLTGPLELPTAEFDFQICDAFRGACIEQPGGPDLEGLNDRPMHRLQYRNLGTHQSMVVSQTVDAEALPSAQNGTGGIRWYELRKTSGDWEIAAQGTFAPGDGHNRWMPSAAMDASGNMAIGYSVSSDTLNPGIRYTGRLATDPNDQMQAEVELIAGGNSFTIDSRWGDYSSMNVDPVDDCTFWYTQEYIGTTNSNWRTRVGAFRFPSCVTPEFGTLEGDVTESAGANPVPNARVVADDGSVQFTVFADGNGFYRFNAIPPGTYSVTASAYGFAPNTVAGVVVVADQTTTQDIVLTALDPATVSGVVTDGGTLRGGSAHGWPLYAQIRITASGFATTVYTDPVTGMYSVSLFQDTAYTFTVNAVSPGYNSLTDPVGPLSGDLTNNDYMLSVNVTTCNAPGYQLDVQLREDFDSGELPAGWDAIDNAGSGANWAFDDPGNRGNRTPGGTGLFAIADSDDAGFIPFDAELVSPVIDLTGITDVTLQFATDFKIYNGFFDYYDEIADVDLSTDGGFNWTNVFRQQESQGDLNALVTVPIPAADGEANVKLRFRYYNSYFDYWWQVDNVRVGSLPLPSGPPVVFSEGFDSGIPGTWSVEDDTGGGGVAVWRDDDPGNRTNRTGGSGTFTIADSYYFFNFPMDTSLVTPPIDLSGVDDPVLLFKTDFQIYPFSSAEIGDVDVSLDGGATWPINVFRHEEADGDLTGPATITVPISAAANQPNVQLRFHYYNAYYDSWWQVDDVVIQDGTGAPPAIFTEGFEDVSFPPAGWTVYDLDGTAVTWARSTSNPHSGSGSAWFDDGLSADPFQDGWLETPDIMVPATPAMFLTFWERDLFPSFYFSHTLWVCTGDCGSPPTDYTEIAEFAGPVTAWRKQTVDLSAYAGQTIRLAWRYEGDFADEWFVDDIAIGAAEPPPPMFDCLTVQGGLFVGNVYDANLGSGVNDATVSLDNSSPVISTTTGPTAADPNVEDGFYTLFVPSAGGVEFLTASKAEYASDNAKVAVIPDQVARQDFILEAGLLTYAPSPVEVTVELFNQTSANLTLTNEGALPVNFELREASEQFVILRPNQETPRSHLRSAGTAELLRSAKASLPGWKGKLGGKAGAKSGESRGGFDLIIDDGTAEDSIGLTGGGQFIWLNRFTPAPGDFPIQLNEVQVLYLNGVGVDPGELVDIYVYEDTDGDGNPGTGATFVAKFNNVAVQNADGATFDVYPLDPAPVFSGPGDILIALVNRTAGASANEFPAAIDQTDSQLRSWVGAYGGPPPDPPPLPAPSLWGIIDNFGLPGNWMIRGFGSTPDIVWLTEDPTSGTLAPEGMTGDSEVILLDFDAAQVDQPGKYTGFLSFAEDTPYNVPNAEVIMNVTPPANWGKVAGTVAGLGYCDATPGTALEDANVEIVGVISDLKTDAAGSYARWMPAGMYDVTVTADGHISQTVSITIVAGNTLTQDFDLRPDLPCSSRDPESIAVTLRMGTSTTEALDLTNAGGGELTFKVLETDEALAPLGRAALEVRASRKAPAVALPYRPGEKLLGASAPMKAPTDARRPERVQVPEFNGEGSPFGWFAGAPVPGGIARYAAAQCAETPEVFYVVFGQDAAFALSNKAWRYDSLANEWTQLASVPTAGTLGSAGTCYQGKLYVIGGTGVNANKLFIYDIASDSWSTGANLPRNAFGADAGAWDGKIYLVSGNTDNATINGALTDQVDVYDIGMDSWSLGNPAPVAASLAGTVQAGKYLYQAGGYGPDLAMNFATTRRLDLSTGDWSTGPDLPAGRADLALAITDTALYAIGGDSSGGGQFNSEDTVYRLEWAGWPAGGWEIDSNSLPILQSSNDAGFCTPLGTASRIWSVAGGDPFVNFDFNLFRLFGEESCFSIYGDVPWLSEAPASGTVPSDTSDTIDVTFDATDLAVGTYDATLVLPTNDPGKPLYQVPVSLEVVPIVYDATLNPPTAGSSGNPGAVVNYMLTVRNTGNIEDTYVVSATGNTYTTAFPAIVGPLDPNESTNITVSVTIPQNAAGGATDAATIRITSQGDNSVFRTSTLTTTVNNVFAVTVAPNTNVETTPGSAVTYTLRATNNGNVSDSYGVSITGNSWMTTPSTMTVGPVARGATATFTVTVQVPAGQTSGSADTATVRLTSQGNAAVQSTAMLVTIVDTVNGALVTPLSAVQIGDSGTQVIFTVSIKNIGNASDTFDLTVSGTTWQTTLSATSVGPLAPNVSANVTLTVTIPPDAQTGDASAAILTATSRSNPSITASAALVTRANKPVGAMESLGLVTLALLLAGASALVLVSRRRRSVLPLG
jgi:uncharacterized membrane protein